MEQPRLTPYARSEDFPPRHIQDDDTAVARWFKVVFCAVPEKGSDPSMTLRERQLYSMSAREFAAARRSGSVTCEEYARALVKRARYYRYLNQWIYTTYDRLDQLVEQARALDAKAATKGVEAIAPLYGLPIPMKGTAAVVDYPSGSGVGVLSGYAPVQDSDLTQLIKSQGGLIFGVTNVPEFAASAQTCNPASGQTRNVYGHHLTVGGSSGGSGSAVAAYMCPLAVTEDTGGSSRIPAACNQNFGFDPSRNHYSNGGNPGMTYTNDQLGVNARSLEDVIFYDQCLLPQLSKLHEAARTRVGAMPAGSVRIGAPLVPFVNLVTGEGLDYEGVSRTLNEDVRVKYEGAKRALTAAGLTVLQEEWPSRHFAYLGREENSALEALYTRRPVNGKPLSNAFALPVYSFSGQVAEFVRGYLNAPVSLLEIISDIGKAGKGHNPAGFMGCASHLDETQYRYMMGPGIKHDCEVYNSYFEQTGAQMILLPCSSAATPDLEALATRTVPLTFLDADGQASIRRASGGASEVWLMHTWAFKHLHIPKVVVPTGLSEDGRPTAIQLFGRAVPYDQMFDDAYSCRHDVEFLHLVQRVVAAIQADPALQRADAPLITKDLQLPDPMLPL